MKEGCTMLRDCSERLTEEDRIDERPRVRIMGDPPFPLELGRLICDCGCNVSLPIDPDLVVVNIADIEAADCDCAQALRRMLGRPVVCLLPYPKGRQIARVAALDADLLVFKPLRAEEFKCRFAILLARQRIGKTRRMVQHDGRDVSLEISAPDDPVSCDGRPLYLQSAKALRWSRCSSSPTQTPRLANQGHFGLTRIDKSSQAARSDHAR
jgi:hypothetical protein